MTIVNNTKARSTVPLNSSFTYLPPTITPPATHVNYIFSLKACTNSSHKLEWTILTNNGFIEILFTDEQTINSFPWQKFHEITQKHKNNTFIFSSYEHLLQSLKAKISSSFRTSNIFNVSAFLR